MTLEKAIEILQKNGWLMPDGSLYNLGTYIDWSIQIPTWIILDGSHFEPDDLEAIAVYVRSKQS